MSTRVCCVDGCAGKHYGKGYCYLHWKRVWRHADVTRTKLQYLPATERFWAQVDKRDPDECWPWTGARSVDGYGNVRWDGRYQAASRVSLGMKIGRPLVPGEQACHQCDNPPCVNPAHLFLGDNSVNQADSVAKGRHRPYDNRGERSGNAKLTEAEVAVIRTRRAGGELVKSIAADYPHLSLSTVFKVCSGDRWT